MSLSQIEKLAEKYNATITDLFATAKEVEAEIEAIQAAYRAALEKKIKAAAKAEQTLRDKVEAHPELFEKPRTHVLAGIKVGFQKGTDKLVIDDPEKTCELIRKVFPDSLDTMLKTTITPVVAAIKNLAPKQLKSIGARLDEGEDEVVVKATDSAVAKAVSAHLKSST